MTKLIVSNSICKVENLPRDIEEKLKHELKYLSQDVAYTYHKNLREIERLKALLSDNRFGPNPTLEKEVYKLTKINQGLNRKMYVMLYRNGEFPTGLLPKVLKLLEYCKLQFVIEDTRVKPEKGKLKFILRESFPPMRYYQRTGSRLAVTHGRGILVKPTGTGKSLTMARMIWEMGVKCLVITPSKAISDSMLHTLVKHFGKGRVSKLNSKSEKINDINVCNIQSLIKIKPEILEGIDAVFIDEFHHAAAETYQEVNLNHLKNVYYRIGLTATNFRNDGSDMSLEAVLSEVLYEYTIEQALKDGFLVKPEFRVEKTHTGDNGSYQKDYKFGIVNNKSRNAKIAEVVNRHPKDSIIILVQQIPHGETLKAMIPGSEFIHGEEKDSERNRLLEDFRLGKITRLIGTSVIGEGVDLPIANMLIMAGGGKAKSQIMQNIGRVLRPFKNKDKAIVYDFTDDGSKYLSEHAALRRELYPMYDVNTDKTS